MTAKEISEVQQGQELADYFAERHRVHAATFNDAGLLERAEQLLKVKLSSDPHNPALLERLADSLRRQGKLDEAAGYFKQLRDIAPTNEKAAQAVRILSQEDAPLLRDGELVPLLLRADVLGDLRRDVFAYLQTSRVLFEQAGVVNADLSSNVNEYWRSAYILRSSMWGPWKTELKEALRQMLVAIGPQFGIETHADDRLECQITAHTHHGYYDAHYDTNPDPSFPAHTRKLTYIIYMNSVPKEYAGGDLLVYDYRDERDDENPPPFTRVVPQDGLMVVFPSQNALHEVSIVSEPTGNWDYSRFTINGWLHDGPGEDLI
ncbi:MAG: 2OG-Fe(II) oxygenase [Alphaproteobacteria bacterium]